MNKISFDTVRNKLETLFNIQIQSDLKLTPDRISENLGKMGMELKWIKIENWEKFETGNYNITNSHFINILFSGINTMNENVVIITDECFKDKMAYYIDANTLTEFIDDYKVNYKMDFFQPFDYIFVFLNGKKIILFHHEGYYSKYSEIKQVENSI